MMDVQVLMSTYNGEKYLRAQLDSIFRQKNVMVHLMVRDDASTDNTMQILEEYQNVEVIKGTNIGATCSFLELIQSAGDYNFYAFADQDDVWDENKLQFAVEKLKNCSGPAIYSGNTRLVDGDLRLIKNETLKPVTTLGSALVKNYATGCTVVFNVELMKLLKQYRPQHAANHDWWVNLVCLSSGGLSFYDEIPHMSYRQHGDNTIGGTVGPWKKWTSRIHKFLYSPHHRDLMASELKEHYEAYISSENIVLLDAVIHRQYLKALSTGNKVDDFLFRICELTGKI